MSLLMIIGVFVALGVAALIVHLLGRWFTKRGWFSYNEPKE